MFSTRTDIAAESHSVHKNIPGVRSREFNIRGICAHEVIIDSPDAAKLLKKEPGRYITLDISALSDPTRNCFSDCAKALSELVSELIPESREILAVGLGNRKITSDSIGTGAADRIIATRHLSGNVNLSGLRPVSVIAPGVLGSTGIESAETVFALAKRLSPCAVVLIDALASQNHNGLCKSVQISDTGISPGSGVGNHRFEISENTLGIPCISVGVPTVVDAATLVSGVAKSHRICEEDFEFEDENSFFVTPKDIDRLSLISSRLIATGLNLAFQPMLGYEDIELLMS